MTESSFFGDLSLWVKQHSRTFPPLMPVMISVSQTILPSSTVNMIHLLSSLHPASLTACVWLQCSDWGTETHVSGPVESVSVMTEEWKSHFPWVSRYSNLRRLQGNGLHIHRPHSHVDNFMSIDHVSRFPEWSIALPREACSVYAGAKEAFPFSFFKWNWNSEICGALAWRFPHEPWER